MGDKARSGRRAVPSEGSGRSQEVGRASGRRRSLVLPSPVEVLVGQYLARPPILGRRGMSPRVTSQV